jgi:hypothetical protein
MKNIDNRHGFRPITIVNGQSGVFPTWPGKLKSNHHVALGDVVYGSAGYVRNAATTDKAVLGVCAQRDLYTSSATTPDMLFWPAHDSIIFEAQTSGVASQTFVYKLCDVEGTVGNSTGLSSQEIDENGTTNKNFYILGWRDPGLKADGSSNGTWGRMVGIFAKSKFQARGAMVLSTQYIGY